ncbi:MAG: FecR domain-containing protein [Verrucomicrobiota bacterium]
MNPSLPSPHPAAEEQASLWAARLEGSVLSAADRLALEAWLADAPAHRDLLSQYCQFSADLEQKLPALIAAHAVEWPAGPSRRPRWLRWAGPTALAAAAACAVLLWLNRASVQSGTVATPIAQRQSLTLVDGTRVELNAQTSLQIDITGRSRRVLLASGEAFFDVRKDPARPFIVESPAGSVRVTGTRFNLRTEAPATLEVTVVEGSVQTHPGRLDGNPSVPQTLTAGEQLSAGPDGVRRHHLSGTDLDDTLAWRQGQIVFNGVPLRDALARFARYHGRGITVLPEAAEKRIGGRYSLDDLDGFLAFIEEGLQVRVTRDLNGTVQVSARSAR